MSPISSLLLLAATVSAQVTTSFWSPTWQVGTNKFGFVGSVVAADATYTTAVIDFDQGTDGYALRLEGEETYTMTWGGDRYAQRIDSLYFQGLANTKPDDVAIEQDCHIDPQDRNGNATCTNVWGPWYRAACPNTQNSDNYPYTETYTYTNTYPARLSETSGVETVTNTYTIPRDTRAAPSWCTDEDRKEAYTTTVEIAPTDIATYQLVLTAGLEKLSATQGASVSGAGAKPTESGASSNSVAPTSTNAASMPTFAPAVIGLGAAAAAIFL